MQLQATKFDCDTKEDTGVYAANCTSVEITPLQWGESELT